MKNTFKSILEKILKNLAQRVLKKSNVEIIGVTGSVGKSSTKEAIYTVMSKSKEYRGRIIKSEGNLNNEIGLPLAILGYKKSPRWFEWPLVLIQSFFRSFIPKLNPLTQTSVLILEYAADKLGDINYLKQIAKPKIAVITYVGEAHMEFFESIDKIALEKACLVNGLPDDGAAIINSDNDYTWRIGLACKSKVIFYGLSDKAEIRAKNITIDKTGATFDLEYHSKKTKLKIKTVGMHQVYTVLAAIAVGIFYNIDLNLIVESLCVFRAPEGRDSFISGINDSTIIDSSYNANPTSMKAALETLKILKSKARKIAVLGDMRELGSISKDSHKKIGNIARKIADKIIAVGPLSKDMKADKWFENSCEAGEFLKDKVEKDDIILVKGSHAMEMEEIVERLKTR